MENLSLVITVQVASKSNVKEMIVQATEGIGTQTLEEVW